GIRGIHMIMLARIMIGSSSTGSTGARRLWTAASRPLRAGREQVPVATQLPAWAMRTAPSRGWHLVPGLAWVSVRWNRTLRTSAWTVELERVHRIVLHACVNQPDVHPARIRPPNRRLITTPPNRLDPTLRADLGPYRARLSTLSSWTISLPSRGRKV